MNIIPERESGQVDPERLVCASVSLVNGVTFNEAKVIAEGVYVILIETEKGGHRCWAKDAIFTSNVGRSRSEALTNLARQQRHVIEQFELVRSHCADCEGCAASLGELANMACVAEGQLKLVEEAIESMAKG